MEGGASERNAAAGKQSRSYSVVKEIAINLSGDAAHVLEQLKEIVGEDAGSAEVLVRVGKAMEKDPGKALGAVGELKNLNGEFDVIADSGIVRKSIETEKKTISKVS